MPCSYRITKYTKKNEDGFLTSPPDEWTSFHEIDTVEKENDYLEIEGKYLNTIKEISECMGINHYTITELESRENKDFVEGQTVCTSDIENVARQILREFIWCKLVSPKGEFHFGYDYYMYFTSSRPAPSCITHLSKTLNIEEFLSPYAHYEI
jgi:hypothetical protein